MTKSIAQVLYEIDWKNILKKAIELRPASWSDQPVREWRNAGDTIMCALMLELRRRGVIETSPFWGANNDKIRHNSKGS